MLEAWISRPGLGLRPVQGLARQEGSAPLGTNLEAGVQTSEVFLANRLSAIVTRTGDDGTTGLGDGTRVAKQSLRIAAIGDIDELNSHIGLLLTEQIAPPIRKDLLDIQNDLFDLGAELSVPGRTMFTAQYVVRLDERVAHYNGPLPRLAEFVLPGGSRSAAQAHVCRAVCRRAERTLVALAACEPVSQTARQYCNRLSDLLFVLARTFNREAGGSEPQWQSGRSHE